MNNINVKLEAFLPTFTPQKHRQQAGQLPEAQAQNTDSFAPSEQAKKALGVTQDELDRLREMMENSNEQADASAKGFKDFAKCMKIAARIMNGDVVPTKDHKFLAEKYPDIYERAVLMRRINPDPKKYKSLVEDEEETDETGETPEEASETSEISGTSGDTAVCEASASAEVEISE